MVSNEYRFFHIVLHFFLGENTKDVVRDICRMGLGLHVILSADKFPPWVINDQNMMSYHWMEEEYDINCVNQSQGISPSMGSDFSMQLVQSFFSRTVEHLQDQLGQCVLSYIPTINKRFESRFPHSFECMRDYNSGMLQNFISWQQMKKMDTILHPPKYESNVLKNSDNSENLKRWIEFRNDRLSEIHIEFCKTIVDSGGDRCGLRIGEFFPTLDMLHGSALLTMGNSQYVSDLIVSTDLSLVGEESSPSIVGLLVDTVRDFGKVIHYEVASDSFVNCNTNGTIIDGNIDKLAGVKTFFSQAIQRGLDLGISSLGFSNLYSPSCMTHLLL